MFRPDDIQARLSEVPFRPLRLIASEGPRYDIVHLVGIEDLPQQAASTNGPPAT